MNKIGRIFMTTNQIFLINTLLGVINSCVYVCKKYVFSFLAAFHLCFICLCVLPKLCPSGNDPKSSLPKRRAHPNFEQAVSPENFS